MVGTSIHLLRKSGGGGKEKGKKEGWKVNEVDKKQGKVFVQFFRYECKERIFTRVLSLSSLFWDGSIPDFIWSNMFKTTLFINLLINQLTMVPDEIFSVRLTTLSPQNNQTLIIDSLKRLFHCQFDS